MRINWVSRASRADKLGLVSVAATSVGVGALSESKPLRWSSLMTFSITVCAIWAIVWTLAQAEHARLVRELSCRVATAPENDATLALRQLASLREPPLETIVLAAASPTREVALQAQDSIGTLLRKWQHEAKSSRGAALVAARLERLAAALDAERTSLASLDLPWLEHTTEKMLHLANSAPPESTFEFAEYCESLLLLARDEARPLRQEVVPVANAMLTNAPMTLFAPPSRVALQSIVARETPMVLDEEDAAPMPPKFQPQPAARPRPLSNSDHAEEAFDVARPMPVADPPRDNDDVRPSDATPTDEWAALSSRVLLAEWLNSSGSQKLSLETHLRRRGFGRLRPDVIRLALSTASAADRAQLVRDLPGISGAGTKAWLKLMAEDADADVRLVAVSAMVTSGDRELINYAWNVSLHDHDPRIAALAERLRWRHTASN